MRSAAPRNEASSSSAASRSRSWLRSSSRAGTARRSASDPATVASRSVARAASCALSAPACCADIDALPDWLFCSGPVLWGAALRGRHHHFEGRGSDVDHVAFLDGMGARAELTPVELERAL